MDPVTIALLVSLGLTGLSTVCSALATVVSDAGHPRAARIINAFAFNFGKAANDQELQDQIQSLPNQITKRAAAISIVFATLAGLYPLIAFLVLWLSRGVKQALGLSREDGMEASY